MKKVFAMLFLTIIFAACSPTPNVHAPQEKSMPKSTSAPSKSPAKETTPPPTPSAETEEETIDDDTLAIFHTSGGFAGINEILTVHKDGKLEIVETRRNYRSEARVEPGRLAKLQELISKPEYDNLQLIYQARGADILKYSISTRTSDGRTRMVTTMDTASHPNILSQVITELKALRKLVP